MGTYKIECNIGAACPICGSDTDHVHDERDGSTISETWSCDNCLILITFEWEMPKRVKGQDHDQAERWARDEGTITFDTQFGHGWKDRDQSDEPHPNI